MNDIRARLEALTDAELNDLRLRVIPRLLRERVAAARAAEWDDHEADYQAQEQAARAGRGA